MPVIHFHGPKLPKEKKAELAEKITNAASETLPHIPKQAFVVVMHENELDNFATGGVLVSDQHKK